MALRRTFLTPEGVGREPSPHWGEYRTPRAPLTAGVIEYASSLVNAGLARGVAPVVMSAAAVEHALSLRAVNTRYSHKVMPAAAVEHALSLQAVGLAQHHLMAAAQLSYALTVQDATTTYVPAVFTPADLPGLVHWWHAVDSPKTGSPGDISQIDDLIGALDLVQATGSRQPDDNGRTINSKVVLDFDGADSLATASAPSLSGNGTAYAFWIGQIDALVDADFLFTTGGFAAADDGFCLLLDENDGDTGRLELSWANGTTRETYRPLTPVVGTSGPHLVECWIIGTTGGVNFAVDGTDAAGGTNTVGYGAPDTVTWFSRSPTLNPLDGAGAEFGFCTAVPDAGDRAALLAYAQSYWGTP